MAPTNGKTEGQISIPATGWIFTLTDDSGGPTAVTLLEGTYYHSSVGNGSDDFADHLVARVNAAMGQTWTCSVDASEGGTGKYTLGCGGATCTVVWTNTNPRDLMGFTGDLSGSTSYTSTNQARSLWLPDSGFQALNGGGTWPGTIEADKIDRENAAGYLYSVMGQRKRVNSLTWPAVTRAKTWDANESTGNESFEQFLIDAIYGEASWASCGGPIRWYSDADTDGTYVSYYVAGLSEFAPNSIIEHWAGGRWTIRLPRLVQVPS